jgi:hypothetical protein
LKDKDAQEVFIKQAISQQTKLALSYQQKRALRGSPVYTTPSYSKPLAEIPNMTRKTPIG